MPNFVYLQYWTISNWFGVWTTILISQDTNKYGSVFLLFTLRYLTFLLQMYMHNRLKNQKMNNSSAKPFD